MSAADNDRELAAFDLFVAAAVEGLSGTFLKHDILAKKAIRIASEVIQQRDLYLRGQFEDQLLLARRFKMTNEELADETPLSDDVNEDEAALEAPETEDEELTTDEADVVEGESDEDDEELEEDSDA